jgi:hypothetical protein
MKPDRTPGKAFLQSSTQSSSRAHRRWEHFVFPKATGPNLQGVGQNPQRGITLRNRAKLTAD